MVRRTGVTCIIASESHGIAETRVLTVESDRDTVREKTITRNICIFFVSLNVYFGCRVCIYHSLRFFDFVM